MNQRGFSKVSLLVIAVVVIGAGIYFALQQQSPFSSVGNTSASTQESLCSGQPFGEGETNFLACPGKHNVGQYSVTFGAQIVKSDGEDYEAVVLFGDGEETSVAHWSPNLFNEEIDHAYPGPGQYIASLVLIPKASLDNDVLSRKKKVQELNIKPIKQLHISVEQSGNISVQ